MSSSPATAQLSGSPDLTLLYFHYQPNLAAACVGLAVFALIDLFIIFRYTTQKAPAFMFKLIPLASVMTLGFILRLVCITTGVTTAKFFISSLCMLLSPNILALMNYNTVTEVIRLSDIQSTKPYLNPSKLTIFFIVCTISSSIFQAIGGGIQLVASFQNDGVKLSITGLSIQLSVFAVFGVLLTYVTRKRSLKYYVEGVKNPKRGALIRIYICLTLMMFRIVYRIASFSTGSFGPIGVREWCLYCFDSLFTAICFLVYSTINSCFPKRGEEEEEVQKVVNEKEDEKDLNTLNSFQTSTNAKEEIV